MSNDQQNDEQVQEVQPRILNIDVETAPNRVYTWGLYNQNVALNQIIEPGRIISFAAKFYGEDEVIFRSEFHDSRTQMILDMWNLLDEADAVLGWNSQSFDVKNINREFVEAGMPPPTEYQHVDLLKVVRKQFKFVSNKLDFVAQRLDLGGKLAHTGFQLWRDCLAGDAEAWELMKEYNIQDVQLVEDAYELLRPWITTSTINFALFSDAHNTCPRCGGHDLEVLPKPRRTATAEYEQYRCLDCGYIARSGSKKSRKSEKPVLR